MFEYTRADIAEQIQSLPLLMLVWLRLLGALNLSSVFFIRRIQARWVLGAMLFVAATNVPMFLSMGLVKLGSIPHLVVWIPLVVWLAGQLRTGKVDIRSTFGVWCFAVMLVDLVSVVFDLRDGAQYLLGDRGLVTQNPSTDLPIPTLLVIAVSVVGVAGYSLGFGKKPAANPQEAA